MSNNSSQGVSEILSRHPNASRDKLIPLLQEVQDKLGYLSEDAVVEIGRHMSIPASKIYGVATFYNQFRFQPKGKYHIMLCRGTACHVKGSSKLLDAVVKTLGISPGKTTRDRMFSLEVVACMGACGLAPVVNINGEFYAKATPKKIEKILADCREMEKTNVTA